MDKNDKWLLASQLQKSVRRGLTSHALEAAKHLYDVDRAYLAYRLGVIILEDMASASSYLPEFDGDNPWGAKRFDAKKSPEDMDKWLSAVLASAQAVKSSLACEMQHCVWWLDTFEERHGPWHGLSPQQAVDGMLNKNHVWWERALFSWAGAGSRQYKHSLLPEKEGLDMEASMYYAYAMGFLFVDDSNPKSLQALNGLKALNLNLGQVLNQYYSLLESLLKMHILLK